MIVYLGLLKGCWPGSLAFIAPVSEQPPPRATKPSKEDEAEDEEWVQLPFRRILSRVGRLSSLN
ncbi:hypothetical protein M5D96_008156 [Drosophila gunungcola]|uniref:Uncharacterized protein n=1 Tax=Drosophila gunungcola TaxID=103775 RepID=A0A9P9YLX6_9MUSC|nr:hypothetical protein M5D96_008156 [Drosophila gunungcola]